MLFLQGEQFALIVAPLSQMEFIFVQFTSHLAAFPVKLVCAEHTHSKDIGME